MRRGTLIGRTAAVLAALALGAGGSPAVAADSTGVIELRSTATEFSAPATAAPGIARFHAVTTDARSGWIGLARLRDGVSWETFRENLSMTVSDTPADVIEGSARLAATATMLGGVVIHPGLPGSFTQRLEPGRYLLFDYRYLPAPQPRYRFLTVAGPRHDAPLTPTATLVAERVPGAGPRFVRHGTVQAGQPLRISNAMPGQIIEAVAFPIGADVTDTRLREWFALFQDGSPEFPPDPPFDLEAGRGTLLLSPGESTVLSVPLERGRYVVVNWLKDAQTGTRLVKQGHYLVIRAR